MRKSFLGRGLIKKNAASKPAGQKKSPEFKSTEVGILEKGMYK